MTTREFISALESNHGKALAFEGPDGRRVPADFHITEVRNVSVESVDCGGRSGIEQQTVTQLWSPGGRRDVRPMAVDKARAIFGRVDAVTPLKSDAEMLFEWGDAELRTAVCHVSATAETDAELLLRLDVRLPVCKPALEAAQEADGCCGGQTSACC